MRPEIVIRTCWLSSETCAICGREWEQRVRGEVPNAYTTESLSDSTEVPAPVCDYCVEQHYPDTFGELLERRRHFHSN